MPINNQSTNTPAQVDFHSIFNLKIFLPLFIFLVLVVSLVGYTAYLLGTKNKTVVPVSQPENKAVISGSIDLNGFIPEQSTLEIETRKTGEAKFTTVIGGITPKDGAVWEWKGAEKGIEYEIRSYLLNKQNRIAESDTLIIVAPAYNEVLKIVSTVPPPQEVKSAISGSIDLNGYLPQQSTITLEQRKKGEANFSIFAEIQATDGITWSFNDALAGETYDIQAYLTANGKHLGQSKILTISAPANSEVLTVNSTAQAPVPTQITISGTIGINGAIAPNSSLSIGERVSGNTQFNIIASGIYAADRMSWSWSNAQAGTSYDLQAYLVVNGNTVASSQILTVTAPANNEVLNINVTNQPPAPPADSINVWCLGKSANGLWQVKISYNNNQRIQNAVQYWVTMGTSSLSNQFVNSVVTPPNPKETQTINSDYVLSEGVTYFAQFAYSTCSSCNTFSPFSPSYQFNCTTLPSGTPTPTSKSPTPTLLPTNTPTPTQPVSTPTPIPTDTPEPTPPAPTNDIDQ